MRALRPLPNVMVGATAVMVAVTVSLTGIAGALYGYTDRAAHDLLDRTPYINAVSRRPGPGAGGRVNDVPAHVRLRHQLPLLVWLVFVWILLWGTWSWANSSSAPGRGAGGHARAPAAAGRRQHPGAAAAAAALRRPLPGRPGGLPGRRWPGGRSSGGVTQGAIVQVQLRVDSDLLLTVVAETLSLVPGSLLLDLDREERLISVHLLHVDDLDDVARQKADVLAIEERIVRAFGTAEDIAALEAGRVTAIGRRDDRRCRHRPRPARQRRLPRSRPLYPPPPPPPGRGHRHPAGDHRRCAVVHASLSRDSTVPVLVVVSLLAFVGSVSSPATWAACSCSRPRPVPPTNPRRAMNLPRRSPTWSRSPPPGRRRSCA